MRRHGTPARRVNLGGSLERGLLRKHRAAIFRPEPCGLRKAARKRHRFRRRPVSDKPELEAIRRQLHARRRRRCGYRRIGRLAADGERLSSACPDRRDVLRRVRHVEEHRQPPTVHMTPCRMQHLVHRDGIGLADAPFRRKLRDGLGERERRLHFGAVEEVGQRPAAMRELLQEAAARRRVAYRQVMRPADLLAIRELLGVLREEALVGSRNAMEVAAAPDELDARRIERLKERHMPRAAGSPPKESVQPVHARLGRLLARMDKLRHLLAQVAHQVIAELPDAAGRPGRRVTDAVSVARVETDMGRRADQLVVVDAVQVGVTRDTARPAAEEVPPFGHGRAGIDIILVRAEVLDRRNATFVLDRPELAGLAEAVGLLGVPAGVPEARVRVGEEADALGLKFPDAVARLVNERVVRPVSAMSVCGRDDPRDKCRRHVKVVAQVPNGRLAPLRQVQIDDPQWILHEPCRRVGTRKGLRVPRGGRLQELAVDLPGLEPSAAIRLQHAFSARPEAPRPRSPCLARRADEILQRQLSVDAGRHVALGQAFRIFGAEVNAVAPVVVIADELHRGPVFRIPAAHLVADRRVSGDHPAELRLDQRVVSRQLRKARLREDGPANATAPRIIRLQASLDAIPFQANVLPNREARARARDDKAVLPELGARANAARAGAHSPRNAVLAFIFEFPPEAVLDKQRVTCQTVPGAKNRISRNGPLRNRHHEPRCLQKTDILLRLTPSDRLRRIPSAEPSVPAADLRKEIGN